MAIHDWQRVPDGVFHSFHLAWLGSLQDLLNNEILLPHKFIRAPLERSYAHAFKSVPRKFREKLAAEA